MGYDGIGSVANARDVCSMGMTEVSVRGPGESCRLA